MDVPTESSEQASKDISTEMEGTSTSTIVEQKKGEEEKKDGGEKKEGEEKKGVVRRSRIKPVIPQDLLWRSSRAKK